MKNYASMKKAKIWSVAKKKVVTSPAISEVKDENGIVVRDKQDEMSYDAFNIIKKQSYELVIFSGSDDLFLTEPTLLFFPLLKFFKI